MASTKIEVAYFFFFVFFSIWVTLLWLTCFPSGTWANPVRFSNVSMLTLFMVSGSASAVSCAIIGINYLRIDFRAGHRDSIKTVRSQSPVVQKPVVPVVQKSSAFVVQKVRVPTAQESRRPVVQKSRALVVQGSRALVVQESLSSAANTEEPKELSAIAEPEKTKQDVLVLPPTEEDTNQSPCSISRKTNSGIWWLARALAGTAEKEIIRQALVIQLAKLCGIPESETEA